MKRNITIRETLAWIVLASALFLFSATVAFAQEKKDSNKNTTTIKIVKKENGKTTRIDTTFNSDDQEAVQKVLDDLGLEHTMSFDFNSPEPPPFPGGKNHVLRFHSGEMSNEDREKMKEEMENLRLEMGDLHEKMKDLHIELFSDGDGNGSHAFSFTMPPVPPMPEGDVDFPGDCKMKRFHSGFFMHDMDSLSDADHVVIHGDEDEQPPVFEKEIKGKHGEKIFVYKRSSSEGQRARVENVNGQDLKLYPNPNDGKFELRFHSDKKGAVEIKVYDTQGKEVYSETIKEFNGEYSGMLDLSSKGKGNYILKIMQGSKTMTEKFVVE